MRIDSAVIDDAGARLGTKAETLASLRHALADASNGFDASVILLDQVNFTVAEWARNRDGIIDDILGAFAGQQLVVRSSSLAEDTVKDSLAGAFDSVLNVAPETAPLADAVDRVVASYNSGGAATARSDQDQVLVQPMARDVVVSGVVFSRENNTGADYYVVNYDDFSGRTDTVTGGEHSKLFFVRRGHLESMRSHRFYTLLSTVEGLEKLFGLEALDVEFGIDRDDRIFIFQVRAQTRQKTWDEQDRNAFHTLADDIWNRVQSGLVPREPVLLGGTTVLGEMPDWNPAEILGHAPTPLSVSLYRMLVTDAVWARARAEMGYRDLGDLPLMVDFQGRCYIDVQRSLNSFLPDGIDPSFGRALIDHQIDLLRENPHWHDKIEFEVALTCADFATHKRIDALKAAGFDAAALAAYHADLLSLTRKQVEAGEQGLQATLKRQDSLLSQQGGDVGSEDGPALQAQIDMIANHGTLPFAMLARHGFIAISFLKSMVSEEMLSEHRAEQFMRSVHTITSEFIADLHAYSNGSLDEDRFLARYGHLRPGTYDIRSPRYDEVPDLYLSKTRFDAPVSEEFSLTVEESARIGVGLRRLEIETTPDALFRYMEGAIQGRELSKFRFTRNLSDLLSRLRAWGERAGLSVDDIAFLEVGDIQSAVMSGPDGNALRRLGDQNRERHKVARMIRLPALITDCADVNVVRYPMGRPTFITHQRVTARTAVLGPGQTADIDGKIVLIESADPGYDWIFSKPIKGLITKFGGANSHMAIRCAEFVVPAAIGCGERLFDELAAVGNVELDCSAHTVKRVGV